MEMIGRIRRMHSRGKKSEREILRATGLSRNTVAKWLHEPVEGAQKYRRSPRGDEVAWGFQFVPPRFALGNG